MGQGTSTSRPAASLLATTARKRITFDVTAAGILLNQLPLGPGLLSWELSLLDSLPHTDSGSKESVEGCSRQHQQAGNVDLGQDHSQAATSATAQPDSVCIPGCGGPDAAGNTSAVRGLVQGNASISRELPMACGLTDLVDALTNQDMCITSTSPAAAAAAAAAVTASPGQGTAAACISISGAGTETLQQQQQAAPEKDEDRAAADKVVALPTATTTAQLANIETGKRMQADLTTTPEDMASAVAAYSVQFQPVSAAAAVAAVFHQPSVLDVREVTVDHNNMTCVETHQVAEVYAELPGTSPDIEAEIDNAIEDVMDQIAHEHTQGQVIGMPGRDLGVAAVDTCSKTDEHEELCGDMPSAENVGGVAQGQGLPGVTSSPVFMEEYVTSDDDIDGDDEQAHGLGEQQVSASPWSTDDPANTTTVMNEPTTASSNDRDDGHNVSHEVHVAVANSMHVDAHQATMLDRDLASQERFDESDQQHVTQKKQEEKEDEAEEKAAETTTGAEDVTGVQGTQTDMAASLATPVVCDTTHHDTGQVLAVSNDVRLDAGQPTADAHADIATLPGADQSDSGYDHDNVSVQPEREDLVALLHRLRLTSGQHATPVLHNMTASQHTPTHLDELSHDAKKEETSKVFKGTLVYKTGDDGLDRDTFEVVPVHVAAAGGSTTTIKSSFETQAATAESSTVTPSASPRVDASIDEGRIPQDDSFSMSPGSSSPLTSPRTSVMGLSSVPASSLTSPAVPSSSSTSFAQVNLDRNFSLSQRSVSGISMASSDSRRSGTTEGSGTRRVLPRRRTETVRVSSSRKGVVVPQQSQQVSTATLHTLHQQG